MIEDHGLRKSKEEATFSSAAIHSPTPTTMYEFLDGLKGGRLYASDRLALLWTAAAAWLACASFWRPLALPDEGRYVGVAWEMLQRRDWLVPTLDGLPFFHKPPLWYWLSAASMWVFGPSEWAARLPSTLGATCAAGGLYLFVRRWGCEKQAFKSGVVLLTMPIYFAAAQYANHDMLVAAFISLAVLAATHAVLLRENGLPSGSALLWAYALCALGAMTKGLIGGVLPAMVIAAWSVATRRPRRLTVLVWWPGWLLFLLGTVPWLLAVGNRYPGFLTYFFVDQQYKRFAAEGFNNVEGWWYYAAVLLALALPWTAWLLTLLRRRPLRTPLDKDMQMLMCMWLLAVVGFFSIPQSKLVGYIFPALPPLAFLIAACIRGTTAVRVTAGIAALSCLAVAGGVAIAAPHSAKAAVSFVRPKIGTHDAIVMLDNNIYDLAFYLRRNHPVPIVADWSSTRTDGWAKELLDASRFDQKAAAGELLSLRGFPSAQCPTEGVWIFADPAAASRHPWLQQPVYADSKIAVWRLPVGHNGDPACR